MSELSGFELEFTVGDLIFTRSGFGTFYIFPYWA